MVTATSDVWGSSRFLQIYRISHKETKESGGHWPLCRGPGGSSWAMSRGWWNFVKQSIRPSLHYHYSSAHRKRTTQQSWYILVALNVKCSFKGWKSCSIKNPNCKPLWLLLIWQRGSWDNQSYSCYIIITQTHRKRQSIVTKPPETRAEERLPTNDGGAHIFIIKLLQLCISYQFWYCMGLYGNSSKTFWLWLWLNIGFELKRTFGEVEKWS